MSTTTSANGPTSEIGYSGVQPPPWNQLGLLTNDPAPQLNWPSNIPIYSSMRLDAQVDALLKSVWLPMRRWRWGIERRDASDEVVEYWSSRLHLPVLGEGDPPEPEAGSFNHDDHLRHAFLAHIYGYSYFELYGHVDETSGQWMLDGIAPRLPQTIQQVRTDRDGNLSEIIQFGSSKVGVAGPIGGTPIPGAAIVPYVWEREGANWLGRSMLRPLYKHWVLKDVLMRIDAIKNERWGAGIPITQAPAGAGDQVVQAYGQLAQQAKAGPDAGAGLANGASFSIEGIKGQLPDTIGSIRYHDEQMARDFLAMVLQLGQTQTGSRALGATFVDFFMMSLDATGAWYKSTTNEFVIRRATTWNWGPTEPCPAISYERQEDAGITPGDLAVLIELGAVEMDEELRAWVRDHWSMPERNPEQPAIAPNGTTGGVAPTARQSTETSPTPVAATHRHRRAGARAPRRATQSAAAAPPTPRWGHDVAAVSSQTLNDAAIGHREPTPVELASRADFTAIQASWQTQTSSLVSAWRTIKAQQIAALAEAVQTAVDNGDVDALAGLSAPLLGGDVIQSHMSALAAEAIAQARNEAVAQGAAVPEVTTGTIAALLENQARAVAGLLSRSIAQAASTQALQRYGVTNMTGADVAAGVAEHLTSLSDAYLEDQLGGAMTMAQNSGRSAVFDAAPPDSIYASEILDQATCDPCGAIDGTEYGSMEEATNDYPTGGYSECDGGPRCRGTLVAVYGEEAPTS